jgi:acetylglutamate/LysW-gamma-L-alpha-aminoadipate kinase
LLGAQEALQGGVARVCIGSASLHDVVAGVGTTIATVASPSAQETTSRQVYQLPVREMVSLS